MSISLVELEQKLTVAAPKAISLFNLNEQNKLAVIVTTETGIQEFIVDGGETKEDRENNWNALAAKLGLHDLPTTTEFGLQQAAELLSSVSA